MKPIKEYDANTIMLSSEIFKLLGEPNRLKILLLLVDRKLPVNEIASNLKISKSLVSHHLQLLKMKK
ncbi:helix-turn-helix transcriptional regulator [Thomasclavelia sp.]|uniref:ArsR/SmtB family transcription factor n=1 Tax=Thomasclavelia sp. TaxID=3025757 RepID=UPI0025D5D785|nr:metalloregulator ArsR/SmtB family transcription factor [Thomasclavelia sp.]